MLWHDPRTPTVLNARLQDVRSSPTCTAGVSSSTAPWTKVDDQAIGVLAVFFGVMLGVGGATSPDGIRALYDRDACLQKQLTKRADEHSWYPVMALCATIDINLTKKASRRASQGHSVIGGVVLWRHDDSSNLKSQSTRLKGLRAASRSRRGGMGCR